MTTPRETISEETIRKQLLAWNQHDIPATAAFYTQDAVAYDPQYPQPLQGKEAIKEDAETFVRAFPDIHMELSSIVAKGDNVGFEGVASGTHKGPLEGPTGSIPATNKRVQMKFAIFCRVNEQGLITEERRYFDIAGMAAQLGI